MTIRRYFLNLAIAVDQGWNTVLGGNPDETISSRVGRAKLRGEWWGKVAAAIIDTIFRALGEPWGHCVASIEWDEVCE